MEVGVPRKISPVSMWMQIEEMGKEWGIVPTLSVEEDEDGNVDVRVLASEVVPFVMPTGGGFGYIEEVERPITELSQDYTFSQLLRNRVSRHERAVSMRAQIKHELRRAEARARKEDVLHEMGGDLRRLQKDRVTVVMP